MENHSEKLCAKITIATCSTPLPNCIDSSAISTLLSELETCSPDKPLKETGQVENCHETESSFKNLKANVRKHYEDKGYRPIAWSQESRDWNLPTTEIQPHRQKQVATEKPTSRIPSWLNPRNWFKN